MFRKRKAVAIAREQQDTHVWDLITLGVMLTLAALAAFWLLPR